MEHLFHPWHYAELAAVLPFVGPTAGYLMYISRHWLGLQKRVDDEDRDHDEARGQ